MRRLRQSRTAEEPLVLTAFPPCAGANNYNPQTNLRGSSQTVMVESIYRKHTTLHGQSQSRSPSFVVPVEDPPSSITDDEKSRLLALAVTDLAQFEGELANHCRACLEAVFLSDRDARSALAEIDEWRMFDRYALTSVAPQDWQPIADSMATVLDPLEQIRPILATLSWHQRHQPSVREFLQADP